MDSTWACCLLFAMAILASGSQAQDTSCLTQLVPCLNYLNSTSTTPSSACCDPLKSVIKSDPQCLCNLVTSSSSSAATQGGTINMTQAVLLPSRCGVNVNAASCTGGSSSPSSGSPTTNSGSPTTGSSSPTTRTSQTDSASNTTFSFVNVLLAAILPLIIQIVWG